METRDGEAAQEPDIYRHTLRDLLQVQRHTLIGLARGGKIDNTVMRRILRTLDLEEEEIEIVESTRHAELDDVADAEEK